MAADCMATWKPTQPFVPFLAITHFAAILQALKLRRDGPAYTWNGVPGSTWPINFYLTSTLLDGTVCRRQGFGMSKKSHSYMKLALEVAERAAGRGEVPVGAVIVQDGKLLVRAGNRVEADNDPTAHAEILAIRAAAGILGTPRLAGCDLYVTLEPCAMCAAAISMARIRRLYFGAYDPKGGGVENGPRFFGQPTCHHTPDVYGGIAESECGELLKEFFRELRS